jgi:hypothetical protein
VPINPSLEALRLSSLEVIFIAKRSKENTGEPQGSENTYCREQGICSYCTYYGTLLVLTNATN